MGKRGSKELTEDQIRIVRLMADNNMRQDKVADAMHYSRPTIYYHCGVILKKTGLNPRVFWDEVELLRRYGGMAREQ